MSQDANPVISGALSPDGNTFTFTISMDVTNRRVADKASAATAPKPQILSQFMIDQCNRAITALSAQASIAAASDAAIDAQAAAIAAQAAAMKAARLPIPDTTK